VLDPRNVTCRPWQLKCSRIPVPLHLRPHDPSSLASQQQTIPGHRAGSICTLHTRVWPSWGDLHRGAERRQRILLCRVAESRRYVSQNVRVCRTILKHAWFCDKSVQTLVLEVEVVSDRVNPQILITREQMSRSWVVILPSFIYCNPEDINIYRPLFIILVTINSAIILGCLICTTNLVILLVSSTEAKTQYSYIS